MNTSQIQATCDLCDTSLLEDHQVQSDGLAFCCIGCQAVYRILESRKELDSVQSHPVFQQAVNSGLISNPTLLEELRCRTIDKDIEWVRWHFEALNLWCPACAEVIRLILLQEKGVRRCIVDYATDMGVIEFAPRYLSKDSIRAVVRRLGYDFAELEDLGEKRSNKELLFRLCIGAFCAMNIMVVSYPVYASYFVDDLEGYSLTLSWIACIASLPVLAYSGAPILRRFLSSLRIGYLGMEALVVLGVSAAFGLSLFNLMQGQAHVYFDSMSMIILLVLVGKLIETKAKFSAKNTLIRLSHSLPRRCRKKTENGECFVKVGDMAPGDAFVVLTGEKVPLDGVITDGLGCCDEAVMTGESLPVNKRSGDAILAGTMLVQGSFEAQVTRKAQETALSRIVDMVTHDLEHKSSESPLIDRVVRAFVPAVIVIASYTAFFNGILPAISVVLIACPCALGIAIPLVEAETINRLAQMGAIIRNRRVLHWLGKEDLYFFDKTGTVTKGEHHLVDGLGKLTASERSILKAFAMRSMHPICKAVCRAIDDKPSQVERVEEVVGQGMRGFAEGHEYRFGSASFVGMDENGVLFSRDGELIASLHFEDEIKPEMGDLKLGVPAFLLSGDRITVVKKVAAACGFGWFAECTPLQKREVIENEIKKGKIVAMVGDGINDAPALTLAHVSISVLSASDISIQVSDLLLTTDNMHLLPKMRTLAQSSRRIMKQNLFWAFIYNMIGVGFAATAALSPLFATGAMIVSSLCVVANARRIGKKKEPDGFPSG